MKNFTKKPLFTTEELKRQISKEINDSTIPKQESGKTTIISLRNSKTCVKRAIREHKEGLKNKAYNTEHNGMVHQITHSSPKMNCTIIC